MIVQVSPGAVTGSVQANASKSAMQRACAAALVRKGISILRNPGHSNDDMAALGIIKNLGANIEEQPDGSLIIESNGICPISNALHCGESGLSIRMFTLLAACAAQEIQITGAGSLAVRPMDFFDTVLPQLGVRVRSNGGRLPLSVQGPVVPANIKVDGSLSSQFLTGLLMAYAASEAKDAVITVHDLKSRPYIDLTLQVMHDFGLQVPGNLQYHQFVFDGIKPEHAATIDYTVEGDWSGAAFLLVAGAIAGAVHVHGIYHTSRQADKRIVDALLDAGGYVHVGADSVDVRRQHLEAFVFDATDCPDLFPPLVALACVCRGITEIRGLKRLKHKESDRGITLQEEFAKLNVQIDLDGDIMRVHGETALRVLNSTLNSHHDHRIAMAVAVAALRSDIEVSIRNADAINKSYPDFWHHFASLGARLEGI
jgi:3-phosphoshikimate 1-carboxyvinyltransferase